jgi:hypothetical protein
MKACKDNTRAILKRLAKVKLVTALLWSLSLPSIYKLSAATKHG